MTTEYILDGTRITSLEAFYEQISDTLIPGADWGRNLDSFDEVLRGYFGTPRTGFTLRWTHSEVSRAHLGYTETTRQLEIRLKHCHPTYRDIVQRELDAAGQGIGPTVFDRLVEIIRYHGPGGEEAKSNVRLVLE